MTISVETNKHTYSGDGANKNFAFSFPILDETHIDVLVKDTNGDITTQTLTTHYTITGTGNTRGSTDYASGTVKFVTAPAATDTVIILRDVPKTQGTDYIENATFSAETTEDSFDKLTMQVQELEEKLDRSIKVDPVTESTFNSLTVKGTPAASSVISVDAGGDDLEFVALTSVDLYPVLDEDTMVSDSDAHVATQQSIKAYVDTNVQTDEEVQDLVGAMVTGNTETGITVTYEDGDGTLD